jgi:hypothetical protein
VLTGEAGDDFYFTEPPIRVFMALFGALARVGRMLGYEASSPKHSDRSKLRLVIRLVRCCWCL